MDVNINSITGIPNNYLNILDANPKVIFVLIFVILMYYIIFASLGEKSESNVKTNVYIRFLELLMWSIFILLILLNGTNYLSNLNINAGIKKFFSPNPELNIEVSSDNVIDDKEESIETKSLKKEVFHIPGNKYTYEDAKAIAKSLNSRLATYKEVEEAYNKGADWCSYGWSEGQMALFPTQESKWKNLQEISGHEHDCGRPGINGGYIKNPNVKFGVNCYGIKPNITSKEIKKMEDAIIYKKTKKELEFDKKVEEWKQKIPEILLSPFNSNNWNMS
tara:strand:- start:6082 stop:6912 length:831 start_codon:yes stop_codon:yes gene_type:complete